jgi:hypothetical protein
MNDVDTQTRSTQSVKLALPEVAVPQGEPDIERVLSHAEDKEYTDLRDRAAYVHATGSFPTHLRTYMTALLRKVSSYSRTPVSLDGRVGSLKIAEENIKRLGLDDHPMIRKVRGYVAHGYKIQVSRDPKTRRPYTKVFLYRESAPGAGTERLTVQADGSVKEGWA